MSLTIIILIVIGGLYGMVRYLEATAVFFPERTLSATPQDAGMTYEDVFVTTSDGVRLHGWFIPATDARWNMVFFHGNAGNIADRIGKAMFLRELGFNILLMDYRGYGLSQGRPSEKGLFRDGAAAFDALAARKDVGHLPVLIYGASLGGAVAIDVAAQRQAAALIVEGTFSSMKDMARIYYPWAPSFLISLNFDSVKKIAGIRCPKLLIHSVQDDLIPFALARKLFNAAAGPKEFLEVAGGHNDYLDFSRDEMRVGITRFVKDMEG